MTRLASAVSSSMSGIGTPASPGTKRMPVRADLLTRRGAYVMGRNLFGPIRELVGRGLARLVGRRAALPAAGVRPYPPRPRADRDGGRDDVPLRHSRLRRG